MMNQPPPRSGRRLPRVFLALALGGAAAAAVYFYAGSMQTAAERPAPSPIPRGQVVVARTDLGQGIILRPDYLDLRDLPEEAILPGALTSTADAAGKRLLVRMAAGEQVLPAKLGDPDEETIERFADLIPPGHRALSLTFAEVIGSGGLVIPGDHVDVIATFGRDIMGKDQSMTILQDVRVLAIAQATSRDEVATTNQNENGRAAAATPRDPVAAPKVAPKGDTPAPPPAPTPAPVPSAPSARTVTLAVTPESAQRLALAETLGYLRYVLRRTGDTDAQPVPAADLATIMSPLQPAAAEILAVEISPTNVNVGDTVTVKITVRNTSDKPMETQGPDPGYTYVQGQTFFTQEFGSQLGRWRVGIGSDGLDATELPFRWGLGGTLAPGATTTVTGYVKITHDFRSTNFWAGLVEEGVKVAQNGAGITLVTALPQDVAVVAVDVANVRSGPSIASTVMGQVTYGTALRILGQNADWFKVVLPDQREGWVAAGWIVNAGGQ